MTLSLDPRSHELLRSSLLILAKPGKSDVLREGDFLAWNCGNNDKEMEWLSLCCLI